MTAARQSTHTCTCSHRQVQRSCLADPAQSDLPAELAYRGVTLTAAADRLQAMAPRGALTTRLRQQIGAQKAPLLARLTTAPLTGTGQPNRDAGAALLRQAGASTEVAEVCAPSRTWSGPPESFWADPRPDLTGDHGRWTVLP